MGPLECIVVLYSSFAPRKFLQTESRLQKSLLHLERIMLQNRAVESNLFCRFSYLIDSSLRLQIRCKY